MNALRFFRSVYHDNLRRRQNRRSLSRDLCLYAMNRSLGPLDAVLARSRQRPDLATGFIVGTPRSGTSLLFQLTARYLDLGYPTNFVARYWIAPVVGQAFYRSRYGTSRRDIPLASRYGATRGAHSPHEFSWFWQFHTEFQDFDDLTEAELDAVDWERIRRKLYALAGLTGQSWLFKSLNYTVYNVERFARELPNSRFIYIRRDPRFVVQSILKCRVERYGDEDTWWSIRPRDFREWKERPGLEQVCHQVATIRSAVERDLEALPARRKLVVDYEDLVARPREALTRVSELFDGAAVRGLDGLSMSELTSGNVRRVGEERFAEIEEHLSSCP